MRSLVGLVLAMMMISFGLPARAAQLITCAAGCTTNSSGALNIDYTVPSDGQEYRWDLYTDASHPTATITLDAPNNTFSIVDTSNGNGTVSQSFTSPDFTFNELVAPGHTTITVWSAPNFNDCASNPAKGTICSVDNSVLGNSAGLKVNVSAPVTITFASNPIPEPAAWSLMIAGFLGIGWALRRRRSARLRPA